MKTSINKGMRGERVRYGTILPPSISSGPRSSSHIGPRFVSFLSKAVGVGVGGSSPPRNVNQGLSKGCQSRTETRSVFELPTPYGGSRRDFIKVV